MNSVRRRSHFTGESHQLAYDETAKLVGGEALIPDAQTAAQQWVESAILHRVLHGARAHWQPSSRSGFLLSVKAASPSVRGLRLAVPLADVPAFGAALAMRRGADLVRPPSDEISIRCKAGSTLLLTAEGASARESAVALQCSWKDLRASVATDPYVSAPSGLVLRFHANKAVQLPDEGRAILSSLLRRIALFTDPAALDWLFAWHDWLVRDRLGDGPSPPARLLFELSDRSYGLRPALLHAFGIGTQTPRPSGAMIPRSGNRARPTSAHEILGRRLRSLRQSGGITLTAAGSIYGSTAKITRMELGRIRIKESDLERILTLYGVTDAEERSTFRELNARLHEENWWQPFSHLLDDESCSRFVFESIAKFIWEYDVGLVPNLLQTRAYSEAVMRPRPFYEGRVRGLVEVHTHRQLQALKPGAPQIWAVLDYSAIAAQIRDPDIMREQIQFLLRVTELPHVSIQALGPHADRLAAAGNSFSLLRLRGTSLPDIVHPHLLGSQLLLSHQEDTEPYRWAMEEIVVSAETPERTREILTQELHRIEAR